MTHGELFLAMLAGMGVLATVYVLWRYWPFNLRPIVDPKTGLPPGDHGTAARAIDFALDVHEQDPANQIEFLRAWREGDLADEWPEYYGWLLGISYDG